MPEADLILEWTCMLLLEVFDTGGRPDTGADMHAVFCGRIGCLLLKTSGFFC